MTAAESTSAIRSEIKNYNKMIFSGVSMKEKKMRVKSKAVLLIFIINLAFTNYIYSEDNSSSEQIYFNQSLYGMSVAEVESQLDRSADLFFAFSNHGATYHGYKIYSTFRDSDIGSGISRLYIVFRNDELLAVVENGDEIKKLLNAFVVNNNRGKPHVFRDAFLRMDCRKRFVWIEPEKNDETTLGKTAGFISDTTYVVGLSIVAIPVGVAFSPIIVPGVIADNYFEKKWSRISLDLSRKDVLTRIGEPKKVNRLEEDYEMWKYQTWQFPCYGENVFFLTFHEDKLLHMYLPK
jgi:hypothetical protein